VVPGRPTFVFYLPPGAKEPILIDDTIARRKAAPTASRSTAEGRVYVTTIVGVQIFDPAGKYLDRITTEKPPTNVAFAGPDKRSLYITAREPLYRIKTLAQGPERLGK
jgi:sugar lactone lactonase YvrE